MRLVDRLWKNLVVTMNHRNPEKDCLSYENMMQTVRLTLLDGFQDEPDMTKKLKNLAASVPTLFSSLLPHDELARDDAEDEDDPSITLRIVTDGSHPAATVLIAVKARVYKAMGFPTREAEMQPVFARQVRDAYRADYDRNIIMSTNLRVRWWKKVSFADRYVHDPPPSLLRSINESFSNNPTGARRLVYQRGQYVGFRIAGDIGRLDHIMTHEPIAG